MRSVAATPGTLTISALARRWHVSRAEVRRLVRTGALAAMVLPAAGPGGRSRVRIFADSVEAFELANRVEAPAAKRRKVRRKADVIEFF